MDTMYEIPRESDEHLKIGTWVEIFEAYGEAGTESAIQVKTMRVGSQTLVFSCRVKGSADRRALRPHEGQVVTIDSQPGRTRFRLRLQA